MNIQNKIENKHVAWLIWSLFALIVVLTKIGSSAAPGNVFNIYRQAGIDWILGESLYSSKRFLYSPITAALFAPFSVVSFSVGGAIWRVANIALFAFGTWRLFRSCESLISLRLFSIASLFTVALSWSAARHGQMTLAMAGAMMIAASDLQERRWWWAGLWLAASLALKPLAIVLVLMSVAIYPRVILPVIVCVFGALTASFLWQDTSYVFNQYSAFSVILQEAMNREFSIVYFQIFGLLRTLGVELSANVHTFVRLIFAIVALAIAYFVKVKRDKLPQALYIYAIVASYILLFGAGTERNTYALIVPVLSLFITEALLRSSQRAVIFMLVVVGLFLLSHSFVHAFPGTVLMMTKPIAVCLFAALILWRVLVNYDWPMSSQGLRYSHIS